jgi:polyhydroxyalkanoate synthase
MPSTRLQNAKSLYFGSRIRNQPATPSTVLHDEHHRVLRRYDGGDESLNPVLLVPPLAVSIRAFDFRPGLSVAGHFVGQGRPTYIVDYGKITRADRELGFETWTQDIVPGAVRRVSELSGGKDVDLVSWCMGGMFSLLTVASNDDLNVRSVVTVATPIDSERMGIDWIQSLARVTGGRIVHGLVHALGGVPGCMNRVYYKWSTPMRNLQKPWFIVKNLGRTEKLIHMRATDEFMSSMPAYPGRLFKQLYRQITLGNELAAGGMEIAGREVRLADVRVPVLAFGGSSDVIAPVAAARAAETVLTGAPSFEFKVAPGGHLGVLTGGSAPSTTWAAIDRFHASLAA